MKRQALSIDDVIDAFIERHVETKRKAGTAAFYKGILDTHIRPEWGKKRAIDIKRRDVGELHHKLSEKRKIVDANGRERVVGGPVVANRVMAVLGAMYSWASGAGLVDEGFNPVPGIEKFREEGRERFLTPEEIERLGAVLREAETTGLPYERDLSKPKGKHGPKNTRTVYGPHVVGAVRLLMFTGCRLREILHLEWDHVDVSRGLLLLPDSKSGKKAVVLSAPAAAVLAGIPRIGRFVIASESAGTEDEAPRHDLKKPWSRLTARAGLDGLRIHDLRHTFASIGAGSNLGLPVIGKLLGHSQASTTQKYAHLAVDPMKQAADLIANKIAASLGDPPTAPSAEIIQLRGAKG